MRATTTGEVSFDEQLLAGAASFVLTKDSGEVLSTDEVRTVVTGTHIYVDEADDGWTAIEAPWPGGCPVADLYWLLGSRTTHCIDANGSEFAVEVQPLSALAAQAEQHVDGVRYSLEFAGVDINDSVVANVRLDDRNLIEKIAVTLTAAAGDGTPMSIETKFSNWGIPVTIEVPEMS